MRNAEVIRQWQILREIEGRRTGVTIHELAARVSVTTRTIRRDLQALQEEQRRIAKENRRKQEDYDKKVVDGKKRVADLNARFANWYYVVPDQVYRKLHLGRNDIIVKKSDKPAQPTSLDEFEGGLGQ